MVDTVRGGLTVRSEWTICSPVARPIAIKAMSELQHQVDGGTQGGVELQGPVAVDVRVG